MGIAARVPWGPLGPQNPRFLGTLWFGSKVALFGPFNPSPMLIRTLRTFLEIRIDFLEFCFFEIWALEFSGLSAHISILGPLFSINLDLGKWTSRIFVQAWILLLLTELVWTDLFSSHLTIPLPFSWNYFAPNPTISPNPGSGHFLKSKNPRWTFLGPSKRKSGRFFCRHR